MYVVPPTTRNLASSRYLTGRCCRTVSIALTGRVYGGAGRSPMDARGTVGNLSARQPTSKRHVGARSVGYRLASHLPRPGLTADTKHAPVGPGTTPSGR